MYGWSPRMRFDLGINLFIEKSLWKEEIHVYGGNQWRPVIHVKDAAQALVMAVEDSTLNTTLNLVGKNHLVLELAKQIFITKTVFLNGFLSRNTFSFRCLLTKLLRMA